MLYMSREPNLYIILSTCTTKDPKTNSIRNLNESVRENYFVNTYICGCHLENSKQEIHTVKNELAYQEADPRSRKRKETLMERDDDAGQNEQVWVLKTKC